MWGYHIDKAGGVFASIAHVLFIITQLFLCVAWRISAHEEEQAAKGKLLVKGLERRTATRMKRTPSILYNTESGVGFLTWLSQNLSVPERRAGTVFFGIVSMGSIILVVLNLMPSGVISVLTETE